MRLEGYVYLATDGSGFYKIGATNCVTSRIAKLSCGNPRGVHLVHAIPADRRHECENYLHRKYSQFRHHNEWFQLPDHAIDYIKSIRAWEDKTVLHFRS